MAQSRPLDCTIHVWTRSYAYHSLPIRAIHVSLHPHTGFTRMNSYHTHINHYMCASCTYETLTLRVSFSIPALSSYEAHPIFSSRCLTRMNLGHTRTTFPFLWSIHVSDSLPSRMRIIRVPDLLFDHANLHSCHTRICLSSLVPDAYQAMTYTYGMMLSPLFLIF